MSILCVICARAGSKGIKNKALIKINKKPLISYTIRQAIKSKIFNEVIVSTDSLKIQKIAKFYGAKSWFIRPKDISNDNSSKLAAIRHAFIESEKYFNKKFNICFDLDLTSPLRNIDDIKKSLKKFKSGNYNNLFSVSEAKKNPYFNMVEEKNDGSLFMSKTLGPTVIRRQDAPSVYEHVASIYAMLPEHIKRKDHLLSGHAEGYNIGFQKSFDVDSEFDFRLVEYLMKIKYQL